MNFTISEKKKQVILELLQTFLNQRLELYKELDDAGELQYSVSAIVSNIDKIEITDIKRVEGIWSVDLLFYMNRIFSVVDEDLIYDLSSSLTDYIGENDINISQQESEYDL
jgi:hypothetical protein